MDPLKYFSRFQDLSELIFQHFVGNDLLHLSEVNGYYWDYIATSLKLMKRIKLVIKANLEITPKNFASIHNSIRLYQNLEVRSRFDKIQIKERTVPNQLNSCHRLDVPSLLVLVLAMKFEWQEVNIKNTYFNSKHEAFEFFSSIEGTVEKLSLDSVEIRKNSNTDSATHLQNYMKFPKLKFLRLNISHICPSSKIVEAFLSNCSTVEDLELNTYRRPTRLLRQLKNLKSLKLLDQSMSHIFSIRTLELSFPFQLTSFTNVDLSIDEDIQIAFLQFLETQSNSLESLTIKHFVAMEILAAIMKMPKLKSLSLVITPYWPPLKDDKEENYEESLIGVSISITELTILCYHHQTKMLKFMLKAVPNAKLLGLTAIEWNTVEYLLERNKRFEKIVVKYKTNLDFYDAAIRLRIADEIVLDRSYLNLTDEYYEDAPRRSFFDQ